MANVDTNVSEATIQISMDGKEIGNTKFQVAKVPKPFAKFGTVAGVSATASELANQNFIVCAFDADFPYKGLTFMVARYSIFISHKDTSINGQFFTGIKGHLITPPIKAALGSLKSGDMIYIFSVDAMGPDKLGLVSGMPTIIITVE